MQIHHVGKRCFQDRRPCECINFKWIFKRSRTGNGAQYTVSIYLGIAVRCKQGRSVRNEMLHFPSCFLQKWLLSTDAHPFCLSFLHKCHVQGLFKIEISEIIHTCVATFVLLYDFIFFQLSFFCLDHQDRTRNLTTVVQCLIEALD